MCDNRSMTPDETAVSRLRVDVEHEGGVSVVRCGGKLVAGVNDFLYTEVSRVIPESKRIVLDLTELTYMDSMGLGTVIRLYVSAKSAGCSLELVNIGQRVRELLGVTHLLSLFTACGEHHVRMP
jgi:anti-sigma B factor antagonist